MPNTTPSPSEILSALQSPYYGMVTLGLASQAYTAQNDWNEIPTGLYNALTQTNPATGKPYTPQLPGLGQEGIATPDPIPGAWSLDWGPANGQNGNGDNSNLLYIASYRASGNPNYKDAAPYFFAVAIRGTDTSVKGLPLDQQILQDIRDFVLVDWKNVLSGKKVPTPNTTDVSGIAGNVAHGSMLGFAKIANFTAPLNNGQPPRSATGTPVTVIEALNQLLAQYPGTPVVVTGHSLGAALTQLMASYLAWQLGSKTKYNVHVIPHCFAPPTAGDQGFVDSYQAACPGGSFWFNTFDFVPYAYITVQDPTDPNKESGLLWARDNLWTAYQWPVGSVSPAGKNIGGTPGPALPAFIADAIDGFKLLLPKNFVRPGSGQMQLDGAIPQPQTTIEGLLQQLGGKWPQADPTDSTSQLAWQHFPPCYFGQMWGQYSNRLAWFTVASYRPHPVS